MARSVTRKISALAACVLALSSGCGAVANRPAGDSQIANFKESARKLLVAEENNTPRGAYCHPGFSTFRSGVVNAVRPGLEAAGLRAGDRLAAVNGRPDLTVEERVRAITSQPPNSEIALTVRRAGEELEIKYRCEDGGRSRELARKALEAILREDWQTCKDSLREFMNQGRVRSAFSLGMHYNCNEAERIQRGRLPTSADASLLYDRVAQEIAEDQYDAAELKESRGSILADIEWLSNAGYSALAQELRAQLSKATARAQSAQGDDPAPSRAGGYGTCFAVTPDGGILTAFHVVRGAREIAVVFGDGAKEPAVVEQAAMAVDVALLRVKRKLPAYLSLAPTRAVALGEPVFTIGFPVRQLLGPEAKFTEGAVSAFSGYAGESSLLQITVPIQPGNSGGPLANYRGQVVGIVTASAAIPAFIAAAKTLPQGVNWAVKSDYALPLFASPAQPPAKSRDEAIKLVRSATCLVEAK